MWKMKLNPKDPKKKKFVTSRHICINEVKSVNKSHPGVRGVTRQQKKGSLESPLQQFFANQKHRKASKQTYFCLHPNKIKIEVNIEDGNDIEMNRKGREATCGHICPCDGW
jgi:hypothetical protein